MVGADYEGNDEGEITSAVGAIKKFEVLVIALWNRRGKLWKRQAH